MQAKLEPLRDHRRQKAYEINIQQQAVHQMPGYVLGEPEKDTENDTANQAEDESVDPKSRGRGEAFQTVIQKAYLP